MGTDNLVNSEVEFNLLHGSGKGKQKCNNVTIKSKHINLSHYIIWYFI